MVHGKWSVSLKAAPVLTNVLEELLVVRLERMLRFVLGFCFSLFFKMLLRCGEAPLCTTPGPRALKPSSTNSKEIAFPIPPAGLETFCSKAALTLWVAAQILEASYVWVRELAMKAER